MKHARAAKGPLQIIILGLSPLDVLELEKGGLIVTTGGGVSITLVCDDDQESIDRFLRAVLKDQEIIE